jgi:6-phosphogluconolactonase
MNTLPHIHRHTVVGWRSSARFVNRFYKFFGLALVLCGVANAFGQTAAPKGASRAETNGQWLVYIGTYTGAKSKGIYAFHLSRRDGSMTPLGLSAEVESPSFLAVHPNQRFLYAANEINKFGGKSSGGVSAFAIDKPTGKLKLLNQQPSGGSGPCYLVVDKAGKNVLVANYGGGSVSVLPLQADGQLGEASAFVQHTGSSVNPQRQKEPHAHSINLDPANHFAFVADLGLDKILVYRFDPAKGTLTANDPPAATVKAGAGPRHFAFYPTGRFAYVINEIQCTVTAFSYDPKRGELKELQTISTLPAGESVQPSYSTAEVQVHPSGRFLYGSNRGHNSIAVFSLDSVTGQLTAVDHVPTQGKVPRNFGIDPTGTFLLAANQNSDSVVVFRIDRQTGKLTPTGHVAEVGSPVCVKFVTSL